MSYNTRDSRQALTKCSSFKIAFIGDANTGKTSLIVRFVFNSFDKHYQTTIGVDFLSKMIYPGENTIRFQLWDTAGQERFRSLIPSYIRNSAVVVITFDVNDHNTFASVVKWIEDVKKERGAGAKILLVGTKIDLGSEKRQVSKEEAEAVAQVQGITYREISSKTGFGINALFQQDIVSLLPVENTESILEESDTEKTSLETDQFAELKARITKLTEDYPRNADVTAIADILRQVLLNAEAEAGDLLDGGQIIDTLQFFEKQFAENQDDNLRAHLKKLAWTSRSMLNTVVNVVIAVLQKVYAVAHALAYCVGLVAQQTAAYPAFWAFGERQQAKNLCNDVLAGIGMTLKG